MTPSAFAARLDGGMATLQKALQNPQVAALAQSLNLDLNDPVELGALLTQAQSYLPSVQVTLSSQLPVPTPGMPVITDRYVRQALKAYQDIANIEG